MRTGYGRFINCSKNIIWSKLSQDLSCMIPAFLEFSGNNPNIRECKNLTEASVTVSKLSKVILDFIESPHKFGCPLPCERKSFRFNLERIHENAETNEAPHLDEGSNFWYISYYYSTLVIEEQVETLIYDVGGFLAAAGGNLGLCLGFSCLSVLFTFSQWSTIAFQRMKNHFLI